MKKVNRSSSSKVNKFRDANSIAIGSLGAVVTCHNNSLHSICNQKLPEDYASVATVEFHDEQIALQVDDHEHVLTPQHVQKLPIHSYMRDGRMTAQSDPMYWETMRGIELTRTVQIVHCDLFEVRVSLKFLVKNVTSDTQNPKLKWQLTLPSCMAFSCDPRTQARDVCEQGDIRPGIQQLIFSLDSQRLDSVQNRLITLKFKTGSTPRLRLAKDKAGYQKVTALIDLNLLNSGKQREVTIDLHYHALLHQQMSDTVFLVSLPGHLHGTWQSALAAIATWVDPLETYSGYTLGGTGFRRYAPILWFDRKKPLPDQIPRFLHNMLSLRRIIIFGEVLHHDMENLLTALLDKEGTAVSSCLHVFTEDEYYRDQVNVLRGNIQARMIIADESPERVERLAKMIGVTVVPDPNLYPLALRDFMRVESRLDFFNNREQELNCFLIPADTLEVQLLAALCVPLARYLSAPVLLWNQDTKDRTIQYLAQHKVCRLFLIGQFTSTDKDTIELSITNKGNGADEQRLTFVSIPYQDPISASAALARLFKVHFLLDWLIQGLKAEGEKINDLGPLSFAELIKDYKLQLRRANNTKTREHTWSKSLVDALSVLAENKDVSASNLILAYQDVFIGRDEFVNSIKDHFYRLAMKREDLLHLLSPVWNDIVVLCDFDDENYQNINIFPAACFAAYRAAPLLLFPKVSHKKETFLDRRVQSYEEALFASSPSPTRHLRVALPDAVREQVPTIDEFIHLVFPPEILTALQSLRPLTLALYNSDIQVPYEAIPIRVGAIHNHTEPLSLQYGMGHLTGIDIYETAVITGAGMLYAHELQRQSEICTLLLMVGTIPGMDVLKLDEEIDVIRKALQGDNTKSYKIETFSDTNKITKEQLLSKLAGATHIFHYGGHGYEVVEQPQRSGIVLWPAEADQNPQYIPLNALEIKYRTKLGAHPLVFLNTCVGSRNSRITYTVQEEKAPQREASFDQNGKDEAAKSMAAKTGEQIMGVSSSFIHIGAAAVMAPFWQILDSTATLFAGHWYQYLNQGCSISEAALLAKRDTWTDMQSDPHKYGGIDYRLLSYMIYGDPTLRVRPLSYLTKHYPATAKWLIQLKLGSSEDTPQ